MILLTSQHPAHDHASNRDTLAKTKFLRTRRFPLRGCELRASIDNRGRYARILPCDTNVECTPLNGKSPEPG